MVFARINEKMQERIRSSSMKKGRKDIANIVQYEQADDEPEEEKDQQAFGGGADGAHVLDGDEDEDLQLREFSNDQGMKTDFTINYEKLEQP